MKITIHYIWFKDYRGFKNQGINFSSEYEFKYDPDDGKYGSVSFKDNRSEYIEGFFGKNIDVTAIVGQNGIGKTSLLRFFLSLKTPDKLRIECAIIFEIDAIFYITIKIKGKEKITFEITKNKFGSSNKLILGDAHKNSFAFKNHIRYIYLTEMFNMNQYTASEFGEDDLSFASVLYNQTTNGNEEKHVDNPVTRYIHRINEWQLAFLSNGREYVEQFKIRFPQYLNIEPSYDENAFNDFYVNAHNVGKKMSSDQLDRTKNDANKFCKTFLKNKNSKKITLEDKYASAIFMNIFSTLKGYDSSKAYYLYKMIMNNNMFQNESSAWKTVYKLLKTINKNNQTLNKNAAKNDSLIEIPIKVKEYIAFMEYFQMFIPNKRGKTTKPKDIKIPTEKTELIYTFFEKYKQCVQTVDFLSFSWGLSSGETLLLNQFGKLMYLLKKNPNGSFYLPEDQSSNVSAKNTVIMLDEAEVAFHPEWQRIYFKQFLKFVEKNIAKSGTHVQIIIATHSPIMLSDIPRQNTLLLKKDDAGKIIPVKCEECKETFAANIFSLYQNSFFIDDTGIGAFAKNMLEDIVKAIHKNDQKKTKVNDTKLMECGDKELMKYIETVGDVYLRAKLKQEFFMYHDMDKKTKEDNKVALMRAELRQKDDELAKTKKELEIMKKKLEARTNDQN